MDQLQLQAGDLVLNGNEYGVVSGATKLVQDLGMAIQYPYQSDPFHPMFGSLLNRYVGMPIGPNQELLIRSEITRVINAYMSVKLIQLQTAGTYGQASPFAPEELISDITGIDVAQFIDSYAVQINLQVYPNSSITLTAAVS